MATRRELLAGLGAGLVLLQAQPAGAARRRRCATMGDVERLEREIRDMNQRLQNALARVRRTGFAPGAIQFGPTLVNADTGIVLYISGVTAMSNHSLPFPGSVIALSLTTTGAISGTPGVDYYTATLYKNAVATSATVVLEGGDDAAVASFDKGEITFEPGDTFYMGATRTGSPGGFTTVGLVWVSFT